jgi:hypothetical protein
MTRLLAPLLLTLALAGCERASRQLEAAQDVRAFLAAVETTDRAAFERHVDRAALKADILRQAQARAAAGDPGPAAVLATQQGQQLVERLITPETFRLAIRNTPVLAERTPSAPEIAAVLRTVDDTRVCLPQGVDGPCAATFARQGETWRLVGVDAQGFSLTNVPWPPSAAG